MRKASVSRKTKETEVEVELNLDGERKYEINTSIGFLDHMLELFAFHGNFDLNITAKGDIHIDYHHTVEDIGIALGQAIDKALSERKGIKRYGFASVPMDEALTQITLDAGGRPCLIYNLPVEGFIRDIDVKIFEEFFKALANNAKICIHINVLYGKDLHHILESVFKAFARSLKDAVTVTGDTLPSTKGII